MVNFFPQEGGEYIQLTQTSELDFTRLGEDVLCVSGSGRRLCLKDIPGVKLTVELPFMKEL